MRAKETGIFGTPMPTLANALLAALKDHGAREIFGIPGDFVLPLFKVIEESSILPNFTLCHEPAVGIAGAPGARERTSGFLLHHQARTVDTQLAVFKEITCDQAVLTDPVAAPA